MKFNTQTDKIFTKQKRTKERIYIFFLLGKKKTVPVLFKKNLFWGGARDHATR